MIESWLEQTRKELEGHVEILEQERAELRKQLAKFEDSFKFFSPSADSVMTHLLKLIKEQTAKNE